MKKFLGIIIVSLLVSSSSYAAKQCTAEDEAYVIEMNSDDYGGACVKIKLYKVI